MRQTDRRRRNRGAEEIDAGMQAVRLRRVRLEVLPVLGLLAVMGATGCGPVERVSGIRFNDVHGHC